MEAADSCIHDVREAGGSAKLPLIEKLLEIQVNSEVLCKAALSRLNPGTSSHRALSAVQVCARCCLRFAGMSNEVYTKVEPDSQELKAAIAVMPGDTLASKSTATVEPAGGTFMVD